MMDRLSLAFANCDPKDWDWLMNRLDHSGHGRFWRAVLSDVRYASERNPTKAATSDQNICSELKPGEFRNSS